MRQYEIYLIEDEIARHYFGTEWKLYDLFLESKQVEEGKLKHVIQKQIRYVIRPIPLQKVEGHLMSKCRRLPGYKADRHRHTVNDPGDDSFARLELRQKKAESSLIGKIRR
ncbi:sporulation inhibitor of replication protein SirA [Terrilactibacillus sp. S3-3]|nr:sporulation inhibitor of replication protein SirA [Terrilactibacillus sp. S3-3]